MRLKEQEEYPTPKLCVSKTRDTVYDESVNQGYKRTDDWDTPGCGVIVFEKGVQVDDWNCAVY